MSDALKFDNGKDRWSLLCWDFIRQMVRISTHGASKYADWNWQKWGPEVGRVKYYEAAMRHLNKYWIEGERNDPDHGQHHLAAAAWNLMAVWWFDCKINIERASEAIDEARKQLLGNQDTRGGA